MTRLSAPDQYTKDRRLVRQGCVQETQPPGPPAQPGIKSAMLGIGVSPKLTAALRAIMYIVLMAAGNAALIYLQVPPVWLLAYSGILAGAVRAIEGVIDQSMKPGMNQGGRTE